ncbi:hypothetical protein WKH21_06250 [Pantoea agglomerans]|jgi:hypothetical protein|uniref:hypothetical protein n=1 Tax=Enterobacter agglomerans TaxID=549 RepID=UPI001F5B94F1|nr:hypothetical protein [Pantoea agglomerans]
MAYKPNPDTSKEDIHRLDKLFYYIGSRWVMLPLWLTSVALGAIISWHEKDWTWLARFGAIGVMIGTLLTLSPLFRGGIYLSNAEAFAFASLDKEGKTTSTSPESRSTSINIVIGVALIIVSSVINAFGDWIAKAIL